MGKRARDAVILKSKVKLNVKRIVLSTIPGNCHGREESSWGTDIRPIRIEIFKLVSAYRYPFWLSKVVGFIFTNDGFYIERKLEKCFALKNFYNFYIDTLRHRRCNEWERIFRFLLRIYTFYALQCQGNFTRKFYNRSVLKCPWWCRTG